MSDDDWDGHSVEYKEHFALLRRLGMVVRNPRAICKSTIPAGPLLTRPMLPVSACLRAALGYA